MANYPNPEYTFQIDFECPHCRRSVDFIVRQVFDWSVYNREKTSEFFQQALARFNPDHYQASPFQNRHDPRPAFSKPDAIDVVRAYGFGTCPKCYFPSIVLFKTSLRDLDYLRSVDKSSPAAMHIFGKTNIQLIGTIPSPLANTTPNTAPAKVKELWPHTLMSLERGDPPSRIVSECRSILDVCLKELGATEGGRKQRIAHLKANHILTEDLATWGEFLWDDGNDAVHDIEATHEDARKHVEYLKLFFSVAFDLPADVRNRLGQGTTNEEQ
ncbi:DUF4145 domain-containing protein [Brucella sp. 10RB9214]|uniref:DUF4145 domain-containing protein n=1 Tax=Brucella sp. 10RB9214 TaxID=1844040 RepID=UPI0012AE8470|nr:DUF4145 domain-containing protein [Brucella sp. 10RB9214]MRN48706.1 DUF4145 domain-containing protein [Brucella sp. 10RB9214]